MFKTIFAINPSDSPVVLTKWLNRGGLHNLYLLPINFVGPVAYVWPYNPHENPTSAIIFWLPRPPPVDCDLLLETGGNLLLETSGNLLLENC